VRLGEKFEPELWKYLGQDVDKQDRIFNFLLYPEYLHGNPPMPYLAMQIQLKSLSILQNKTDLTSRSMYVTANVNAAILAGALDLVEQAALHKKNAEEMMAKDAILKASFPAIYDYERCIYDSIGTAGVQSPATACLAKKSSADPRTTVIEVSAVPQEKIIAKPEPRWTKAAKAGLDPGIVKVRVLIDENGNVESTDAVSGPAALQSAALTAARGAHFRKTLYEGQPVKVRGVLAYSY
jgi:hypothetical protein